MQALYKYGVLLCYEDKMNIQIQHTIISNFLQFWVINLLEVLNLKFEILLLKNDGNPSLHAHAIKFPLLATTNFK